jgi:hypothetical protein
MKEIWNVFMNGSIMQFIVALIVTAILIKVIQEIITD